MAGRGGLVAATEEQRMLITSANGDQAKVYALDDVIGLVGAEYDVETDKAWDPIHRILAREDPSNQDFPVGSSDVPLELAILGGKPLLEDEMKAAYVIRLVEPNQVPRVAAALQQLDEANFRALYEVHCRGVEPEFDDDGLEYAWEYFQSVRDFYVRVADSGRCVIFGVGI